MAIEVHVWVFAGIKPQHVGIDLTKIDPDFLGVLPFVDLFVVFLAEADFGAIHVEGNDTCLMGVGIAKCNVFVSSIIPWLIIDIVTPVDAFPLGLLVLVGILLVLIRIEQGSLHRTLVSFLLIEVAIVFVEVTTLVVATVLRQEGTQVFEIFGHGAFFAFFVDHALFFDPLSVLNELVVELVLD